MNKPLTVYKASAGSGKTFALAVQYISLVVENPMSYRNILAVTFTNKATEEMKTRILSQLYGIWKMSEAPDDYPESAPYMAEVCRRLGGAAPGYVSQRAGTALSLLLHNYNHFRVMTIDTFFQGVLRNLARELDLTANLRVELNDAQVEEMAVDQMIENLNANDMVLQWILKYIMENIGDDKSWNVISQIKQFGKTIFREYYKDISKQLNERLATKDFFDHYTNTLRTTQREAKKQMAEYAEAFFTTLQQEGLTVDDLANKRRGIASFFLKLQAGTFDETIENQTVAKCLEAPEKWYAKTHPRRQLIHTLAEGSLQHLLRQAVSDRRRQWRLYQSATLTLRHLNQVRLLSSIENKVRQLNDEANRFLLSDTQKLLHTLISGQDSPFIFERIGTQLEHVMIDEFQDTSYVQWQNFRVLLLETMSRQGSQNLIVGDVKQSIYRWRSGDWRLLNDIEQQFPAEMIRTEPLQTNRRSARTVVEFNNDFFETAAQLEYQQLQDSTEAQQLKRAYSEVRQDIPEGKPEAGHVRIQLLPAAEYQDQTLDTLAAIVGELRQQRVPQSRMAILVRTNSYIPIIANYFAARCPEVRIVSDEAFRLDASLPVNILVNALQLLVHPNHQLARAYLRKTLGNDAPADDFPTATYSALPLYELVEKLFADFGLCRYGDQCAYVCAFFDQLSKYTAENPATIEGFLKLWETDLCAKTIQSDVTDGIRLISIHKSKGLEFDHVICPFCDWQLEKTGNVLWCQPGEPPFDGLPIVPVDYSRGGMAGTIYEADYHAEHLQNTVDNLNLLYVAFTRARSSLFVIGKRGKSGTRSLLIEQVLPLISGRLTGLDDETAPIVFERGALQARDPRPDGQPAAPSRNVFLQQHEPIAVSIQSYDSRAEFRQSNQSHDFTNPGEQSDEYIHVGNVLHRVLSNIGTTADIGLALSRLENEGILGSGPLARPRLERLLRQRLEHPRVAEWFAPPAEGTATRWTLYNECTILHTVDGVVYQRRPDRVMTDGREWVVVDFKFGRPRDEYQQQVREYMRLLNQMGHEQVSGYLWYVFNNKIEEVNL